MLIVRAISTLLLLTGATANQDISSTGPWDTYTAAVIYKRNNPESVAAKDLLQSLFCDRFKVTPCAPGGIASNHTSQSGAVLEIVRDFDILVPQHNFTDVIVWLMQNRLGLVTTGGVHTYSVDLMVYPNSGSLEDVTAYAVYVGHKTPFNTNSLPTFNKLRTTTATITEETASHARVAATSAEDDSIFTACSSDATCEAPYANNTGCTGDALVGSMHFHFYYVANDGTAVDASNYYINMTSDKFGLDLDVCADNTGHEQAHNRTCWLSGPGGSGPVSRPGTKIQIGGSFAYPTFSLYVTRADFVNVLSWTMVMKNKAGNGYGDFDFLIHPNCGCNYADHVHWGLHASTYIPANRQGCAEEAGWEETYGPAIDPLSKLYPGNWPVEGCGLLPSETTFPAFKMHVFYNGNSVAAVDAKNTFVQSLKHAAADARVIASIGHDNPTAFADTSSVALTSEQTVQFNASAAAALVPWILVNRPRGTGVDILLAPLSSGGATCRYSDYVSRALFSGSHWTINEAALQLHVTSVAPTPEERTRRRTQVAKASPPRPSDTRRHSHRRRRLTDGLSGAERVQEHVRHTVAWPPMRRPGAFAPVARPAAANDCVFPPRAYLLYILSVHSNGYQMYSAGLDTYKQGMTQDFAAAFPTSGTCSGTATLEPDYGDELCFIGTNATPYTDATDPMELSYSSVYVPASRLVEVMSWAMDGRVSAKHGYDVDLRLVPLTGCARDDFIEASLKAGFDWRLNEAALN